MTEVLRAGALGIEITISGKIPSSRAKTWRFYQGYLKKCGDIALKVGKADMQAQLKTGVVGVKVSIMPPDIQLPDAIEMRTEESVLENEKAKAESQLKTEEKERRSKKKVKEAKKPRKRRRKMKIKELRTLNDQVVEAKLLDLKRI